MKNQNILPPCPQQSVAAWGVVSGPVTIIGQRHSYYLLSSNTLDAVASRGGALEEILQINGRG